ncbi:sigma-70 family RNA polymerase sigma factor [Streptomyces sp. MNP-20]|uniref:sigma-70 family RNA polymerase sigma factor n=1 Tax=Streptomyces sp. MNP-20 TaxID=2721165 RepID=UPI00155441F8|nr:sigma-70 family RNA polymerase sigma factor [Streptomyces sp. MNP-20]
MHDAALIRAAQTGDAEATAQILEGLEGMIYRLAEGRLKGQSGAYADRLEDLRQEGRLAALEALAAYDPEGGAKFSTYAHPRIRGAIFDGANPAGAATADAVATFKRCLGVVGGNMEAAEYLATVLPGAGHKMSAATAHVVRLALEGVESLDAPGTRDEESFPLAEALADPRGYGVPEDLVEPSDRVRQERERKTALAHALLESLTERAGRVVRMTYGFAPEPHLYDGYDQDGLPVPDHKAIAEVLEITVATSRQTLKRALDRMRQMVELHDQFPPVEELAVAA